MKILRIILVVSFITSCAHHKDPGRVPQSATAMDCGKKITQYHDSLARDYLENFPVVQTKHLQIMGTYLHGLKTQIARLSYGIQYETQLNPNNKGLPKYYELLSELVFTNAYFTDLYYQLKNTDVKQLCHAFAFGEVTLTEEDFRQTIARAKQASNSDNPFYTLAVDFEEKLVKYIFKNVAKEVYYDAREKVIEYIAWNGIKAIARRSLTTIGTEIVIGAAKGAVITLVTGALKGGKIPEWTTWAQMISESPEIMLNPDWMKDAGLVNVFPWQVHWLAFKNKEEVMKKNALKLYELIENKFMSRVRYISKIDKAMEDAEWNAKFPKAPAESTGVSKHYTNLDDETAFPEWAIKK